MFFFFSGRGGIRGKGPVCGVGDVEKGQVYGYITKYFESLHTMGDHCIVQDIDDYISSITGNKRIKA